MFEIYLMAKKPLTIVLNGTKINISKSDKKILKLDEPKTLNLDYYFTNCASQIFHSKIHFTDGEYICEDEKVQVIKIKENSYFLLFLQENECFLQKKCKKIVKNGQIFTFYQNGLMEIETENSVLFSEIYDFEITDAEVLDLKNNYFAVLLFGKNEKEFSIIFNGEFVEIINFNSCVIENTENGFKVLTNLFDIAGHGLVEVFEIGEDIKKVDEYSVYMNNAPRREFNTNVLPVYFLQCIKAKDYSEAKKCLSQTLKAKARVEHLSQFFGNFINIILQDDKIYLQYVNSFNRYFAKQFTFDIGNNKIQNIT